MIEPNSVTNTIRTFISTMTQHKTKNIILHASKTTHATKFYERYHKKFYTYHEQWRQLKTKNSLVHNTKTRNTTCF